MCYQQAVLHHGELHSSVQTSFDITSFGKAVSSRILFYLCHLVTSKLFNFSVLQFSQLQNNLQHSYWWTGEQSCVGTWNRIAWHVGHI